MWMLADYAAQESTRKGLGIRVHCLLPNLNPNTDLGRAAVAAYSQLMGLPEDQFLKRMGPLLTPKAMGKAVLDLYQNPERWNQLAYLVSGDGLQPVP
jgi:hypothetical protein